MNYWLLTTFRAAGILAIFGIAVYLAVWFVDPLTQELGKEGRALIVAVIALLGFFGAAFVVKQMMEQDLL